MPNLMEYQKTECLLGIDSFNKPSEKSGKEAWVYQVLSLVFMLKGTIPTDPNRGVGLSTYDYADIDAAIPQLQNEITDQVRTYFPDMPFDSVSLMAQEHQSRREKILIMIINFTQNAGDIETAVVASTNIQSRIDFDISL